MEIAVPAAAGCVGVLVAVGAFVALGSGRPFGGGARDTGPGPKGRLLAMASRMGAPLLASGIVSAGAMGMLAREVRGLSVRGGEPFSSLDDAEALGALMDVGVGCAAVANALSPSPIAALAGSAAPFLLMAGKDRVRKGMERKRAQEAMPEAFGALAISLASGLSLPQAMRYVGSHAVEPVRSEFMRTSFSIGCGVPAPEALDSMLERLSVPGLELVALSLKVSQRTGAPLKGLLAEATRLVESRMELERLLDVKTAQARMSARLVALMPVGMTAALSLISDDFRRGLATGAGMACVSVAMTLNLIAWSIIRKIMEVRL